MPRVRRSRLGRFFHFRVLVVASICVLATCFPRQIAPLMRPVVGYLTQSFHDAFDQSLKSLPKAKPAAKADEKPGAVMMKNGRPVSLPKTTTTHKEADALASVAPLAPPRASPVLEPGDWPRTVAIHGTPEVEVVENGGGEGRPFAARTEHYEFQSDSPVGADVVREMSRVFESTYELNKALPLGLDPAPEQGRPRFVARLFRSNREYLAAGGMPGSAGTYARDQACILVPVGSVGVKMVNGRMQTERTEATETLVHEITHQMMNKLLPVLPLWYVEGSADYVAMADYVHGRFFLNQKEDRLRRYLKRRGQRGGTFTMLRPADLMALDSKAWGTAMASNAAGASMNYASATLLTYYFYHLDGNGDCAGMLAYLDALRHGTPEPEAARTHLIRGRSMQALENDVLDALEKHGINVSTGGRSGVARR